MTPSGSTEVAAGAWLHNPVTGELARVNVGPVESGGRRIETDLWLQPGAAVAGAHVHDHLVERFEVRGTRRLHALWRRADGRPGRGVLSVEPGVVHDWWNAGEDVAHVRVGVEARAPAPGHPAARFASMIEALWSLGALGEVNARGMPDLLWLAAIAREYRDVIRFARPPGLVQAPLFGPLAAIARRAGRDPLRADLHGSAAPCVIPEPDERRFCELLVGPARGDGSLR
jgi:hypothetical protein